MGMINIGAGLSALGNSVAETAGHMALEQQKENLETQKLALAQQLRGSTVTGYQASEIARNARLDQEKKTESDYKDLDAGSVAIEKATTPTDVASLGSAAPGLSFGQREKLQSQEQLKEDKATGPLTDIGKLKADLDAGRISKPDYDAAVMKANRLPPEGSVDREILLPIMQRMQRPDYTMTDEDKRILAQLKPSSNSMLSDEARMDGAWYFIQNGRMPAGARDKASAAAIQNTIADLKPQGMSSEDWMRVLQNNSIALHAKNAAATQGGKMQLATTINEDTVVNSINIMNDLLKKGIAGPTDIVSVNDAEQWMKRQFNDPNAVNLKNAISTISNEYARVMTGQTGGAASSDSARNEAAQRLLLGYSKGTLQAAADQMVNEMQGRSKAYERAITQLTGGAYGGVAPSQEYTSPIAPAPSKAATSGIIHYDAQGNRIP